MENAILDGRAISGREKPAGKKGSYQIEETALSVDVEIKRLKNQVDLFWDEEILQYRRAGVKDKLTILEIGSGPGFVTEKLASEFPNSPIICVERDPNLIQHARKLCGRFSQIQFLNIAAEDIDQIDCPVHVVIARLLLEHLVDPPSTFQMIYGLLQEDGIFIAIDNDFENYTLTFPESPALRYFFDAYCQSREDEGGNPKIGRILPLLFKKSGFRDVFLTTMTAHNIIQGDDILINSGGLGIPLTLVKKGYLSSGKLGQITKEWDKILSNEDSCIMRQILFSAGKK